MYEAFYDFDKPPFSNIPDPAFLFLSPQHARASSVLHYALLARAGFCVITGDVGSGKTTLVRSVLQDLNEQVEIGLISNTKCDSFEELLRWVLLAFGIEYQDMDKVQMYEVFVNYLIRMHRAGRRVALVVDEAQHLSPEILEQLRMLSNVNTEKGQILQTILVGQPELWGVLSRPELEQFAQRISYDCVLGPLDDPETTGEYIRHRLQVAGGNEDLFLSDTYPMIFAGTLGVPRLVNLVCDTALVYAYGEGKADVDVAIVERVLRDKETSLSPITSKHARRRANDTSIPQASADRSHRRGLIQERRASNAQPGTTEDLNNRANARLSTIERAARKARKI
jgi:type II secretory pathway predicted ATPase ExeA